MNPVLREQINVPRICDVACLRKFKTLLSQCFTVEEDSIPSHMTFKAKLRRTGLPREVHIEIFTNENTEIKGSSEIEPFFQSIFLELKQIFQEATNILSTQDVVRVNRARRIMEYMRNISVGSEVERMVIVTLCDVILDLLVTEKLSHFTHRRQDLEDESVGVKVGKLEKQYRIPVYKPKAIRDIRELRNRVAHGGISPIAEEATFARDTTIEIFELF